MVSIWLRQARWTCTTPSWYDNPNILGGLKNYVRNPWRNLRRNYGRNQESLRNLEWIPWKNLRRNYGKKIEKISKELLKTSRDGSMKKFQEKNLKKSLKESLKESWKKFLWIFWRNPWQNPGMDMRKNPFGIPEGISAESPKWILEGIPESIP